MTTCDGRNLDTALRLMLIHRCTCASLDAISCWLLAMRATVRVTTPWRWSSG